VYICGTGSLNWKLHGIAHNLHIHWQGLVGSGRVDVDHHSASPLPLTRVLTLKKKQSWNGAATLATEIYIYSVVSRDSCLKEVSLEIKMCAGNCFVHVNVTARLLTIDRIINRLAWFWSEARRVRKRVNKLACAVRKWVNKPTCAKRACTCAGRLRTHVAPRNKALEGGQRSLINVSLTIITMCENEATRMEPFQQYLAETFPEDGKHSTSVVVHKLNSTVNACWKPLRALGKLPHGYSFYHSSWV